MSSETEAFRACFLAVFPKIFVPKASLAVGSYFEVCRRMAVPTFLRWASLQHEASELQALLRPLGLSTESRKRPRAPEAPGQRGMRFRCGRSDQVELSEEAVNDIFETVRRWHTEEPPGAR